MSQAELCKGSRESLVIHGANTVCGPLPAPWSSVGIVVTFVVAAASASVFLRVDRRSRGGVRGSLVWLLPLLALSLPGYVAVLFFRADAPLQSEETAHRTSTLETSMLAFANAHGCAVVRRNDCEACEPIARLATAHAGICSSGAAIELNRDALEGACKVQGTTLRCGAP